MNKLIKQSILYSISAFIYIVLVSLVMSNGDKLFGNDQSILTPIAVLLLLVLSAAIMGMLVFGKAVILYLDGNKKDAVKLAIYNIVCLFIITIIYLGILVIIK